MKFKNVLLAVCLFTLSVHLYSQKVIPFKGKTTISVKKGDTSLLMVPAEGSEHFKLKLDISEDNTVIDLFVKQYEQGRYLKSNIGEDYIMHWGGLSKGDRVFFDWVPDVSKGSWLTLYVYFPQMTAYRYMDCPKDKTIKYKKFESSINAKDTIVPLMIFYADDLKDCKMENVINKYTKKGFVKQSAFKDKAFLQKIDKCMILYYQRK